MGADADITLYTPHENKEIMFEMPRYVIQGGQIVIEDTELRTAPEGRTLHVVPDYDKDRETDIGQWFEKYYSIRFRNYPVSSDYMHAPQQIACAPRD